MKARWLKRASDKYVATIEYLRDNASRTAGENLITATEEKINFIERNPESGRLANNRQKIRFVLVKKRYRLYYRIGKNHLQIVFFFDTKQHPKRDIYQ